MPRVVKTETIVRKYDEFGNIIHESINTVEENTPEDTGERYGLYL